MNIAIATDPFHQPLDLHRQVELRYVPLTYQSKGDGRNTKEKYKSPDHFVAFNLIVFN